MLLVTLVVVVVVVVVVMMMIEMISIARTMMTRIMMMCKRSVDSSLKILLLLLHLEIVVYGMSNKKLVLGYLLPSEREKTETDDD